MAVETIGGAYVLGRADQTPPKVADFHHAGQMAKVLMDRAVLPAGAEVGSTIALAELKSDAVLTLRGVLAFAALGDGTTLDIGVADDAAAGVSGKTAVLASGIDTSAAGSAGLAGAVTLANTYKPLWQLLGLAEDPGTTFRIVATLGGATSAAGGVVAWEIPFVAF